MNTPGSGEPPHISNFTNTCAAADGSSIIEFDCNKAISGSVCEISLAEYGTGNVVWSAAIGVSTNAGSFTITGTPNGVYTLNADNGENSTQRPVTVSCEAVTPTNCTIELYDVVVVPPTSAGGLGAITYKVRGIQSGEAQVRLYQGGGAATGGSYHTYNLQTPASPAGSFSLLQPDTYVVWAQETGQVLPPIVCSTQEIPAVVPAFVGPVAPPAPPIYYPVGGVLPNPVLLPATVASLTTAAGAVRTGLHLELELRRAGPGGATFATARKTVRGLQETIDVSAYLRPQLSTLQGYLPNQGLFRDLATAFAFAYRYREVDSTGPGPWVDMPNPNYAVLAARPPGQLSLAGIIAELASHCGWASAFPSGEAVQFVGYPLEVGIIIPDRPANTPTFLEAVYYDMVGGVLEIRTWPVLDTAPAGYYRICLPADPLPCAASLFLAVCNENRAFAGSCSGVANPVTTPGGNIIVGQGYLKRL